MHTGTTPSFAQMRLIAIALMTVVTVLGAVFSWLAMSGTVPVPIADVGWPYVDVAVAMVGILCFGLGFLLRGFLLRKTPAAGQSRQGFYFAATIVLFAMLEMGMVFNLVALLFVTPPWINLAVAGLGLAIGLNFLPSEDHYKGLYS